MNQIDPNPSKTPDIRIVCETFYGPYGMDILIKCNPTAIQGIEDRFYKKQLENFN